MSLSECFPNEDDLPHHDDEESLLGVQKNGHQDDTCQGLTLNDLYREDIISEGYAEDVLDNHYF